MVRVGDGEEPELHKRTEVFATLDQVAAAGATAEVGGGLQTALGGQHRQQRQQLQQEQRRDPSSEAEALSNVASGIAASLGLAAGNLDHEGRVTASAVVVPTSEEDGGGSSGGGGGDEVSEVVQQQNHHAIMIDYQDPATSAAVATAPSPAGGGEGAAQVILASDGSIPAGAVHILHDGSISLTSPGVIIAQHPSTSQGATVEAAMAKLHGGEAAATTVATVEPTGGTKKKLEMDWEEDEEEGQEESHSK